MTKQATDFACGIGAVTTRSPFVSVALSKVVMGPCYASEKVVECLEVARVDLARRVVVHEAEPHCSLR